MERDLIFDNFNLMAIQVRWIPLRESRGQHTNEYLRVERVRERERARLLFSFAMLLFASVMCPSTHFSISLSPPPASRVLSTHERAREKCVASSLSDCQHKTLFALNSIYTYFSSRSVLIQSMYDASHQDLFIVFTVLLDDPSSSIDHLQHYQQSQVNYVVNNHATLLDNMDHQQSTILNPHHHPQVHNHQPMPGRMNNDAIRPRSRECPSIIALPHFSKEKRKQGVYTQ